MKTATLVTGIGRCGLSLTMQMLDAGGFPVLGEFPAYEVVNVGDPLGIALRNAEGAAVKVVDPKNNVMGLPKPERIRAILLERDPIEQAKSQIKFLAAAGVPARATTQNIETMAAANKLDMQANRSRVAQWADGRLIVLRFEEIIQDPACAAGKINGFLGGTLDIGRMSSQVEKRDPSCYRCLLEMKLIDRGALVS